MTPIKQKFDSAVQGALRECGYDQLDGGLAQESTKTKTPDYVNYFSHVLLELKNIENDPISRLYPRLYKQSLKQGAPVMGYGRFPIDKYMKDFKDPDAAEEEAERVLFQTYENHVSRANKQFFDFCSAFKLKNFTRILFFSHSFVSENFEIIFKSVASSIMNERGNGRFRDVDIVLWFGLKPDGRVFSAYLPVRSLSEVEDGAVLEISSRIRNRLSERQH
jgi:hypothetical protein